jgi:hypothetical protein
LEDSASPFIREKLYTSKGGHKYIRKVNNYLPGSKISLQDIMKYLVPWDLVYGLSMKATECKRQIGNKLILISFPSEEESKVYF